MKDTNRSSAKSFWDLIQKKSFMEKIIKMQNEKEVVEAFEKEGITLTPENLEELRTFLNDSYEELRNYTKKEIEETKKQYERINEDELSAVAGGEKTEEEQLEEAIEKLESAIESLREKRQGVQNIIAGLSKLTGFPVIGQICGEGFDLAFQYLTGNQIDKATIQLEGLRKKLEGLRSDRRRKKIYTTGIICLSTFALAQLYKNEIKAWFRKGSR